MRILADENIPRVVVTALREAGHHVRWVVEEGRRAPDTQHVATAAAEQLTILTEDSDFARLVAKGGAAPAIILIRLHGLSRARRSARVVRAIELMVEQPPLGSVHVIEHNRVRVRSR